MGTASLLGAKIPEDPLILMRKLQSGLPASALSKFKRAARLGDADVAELLQIGSRTLSRIKISPAQRLPADLSDRLYAVASIYALAEQVLGSRESAVGWLSESQFGLGNRPPLEFLSTELGRRQVRSLLEQIEHGFLA
jgi:putative toxin-antitoxin system antitoxin component (TIGR02293 family)